MHASVILVLAAVVLTLIDKLKKFWLTLLAGNLFGDRLSDKNGQQKENQNFSYLVRLTLKWNILLVAIATKKIVGLRLVEARPLQHNLCTCHDGIILATAKSAGSVNQFLANYNPLTVGLTLPQYNDAITLPVLLAISHTNTYVLYQQASLIPKSI